MRLLILIPAFLASTAAIAAECKSVEGHIGKRAIEAEREAVLQGTKLQLSGIIDGETMPHQTIDCIAFGTGVLCERRSASAITVGDESTASRRRLRGARASVVSPLAQASSRPCAYNRLPQARSRTPRLNASKGDVA